MRSAVPLVLSIVGRQMHVVMTPFAVKLGLQGTPSPGQGLCRWPLQAPHGKERGKFQTLWPLASRSRGRARRRARAPPRIPRNAAILLHCLKESSLNMVLNALVKSIFRSKFVQKRAKHMANLYSSYVQKRATANASQGKAAGIPSLAALSPFSASNGIQAFHPLHACVTAPT